MHIPILPQEIIDYILDHCYSDVSTIAACGLVCRAWYPASRHHLFSAYNISTTTAKKLLSSPSEYVRVAPFFRELELHLEVDTQWWDDFLAVLPDYVPLRTLWIFCHGIRVSETTREKLTNTFRNITYLALIETTSLRRSLSQDVAWICSFPDLEKVYISGDHYKDMDIDPYQICLPKRVQELKLNTPSPATEALMRWLLLHNRVPTVSSLLLFRVTDDNVPNLKVYLHECRDVLKDLMLFLYQGPSNAGVFDLSQHAALQNIYLSSNGSSSIRTLRDILSTSTGLGQMQNVLLRVSSFELAELYDWASLDKVFSAHTAHFIEVTLVMDEDGRYESELAMRLPMCARRRQLHFVNAGVHSAASTYVEDVYSCARRF
ncbi:hypothetical protein Moror_13118 [Moniliophthora roreri MCA 2997]|uniref:F-box domain-containing protein n=2 Tax=Moniliophthora roreri TaxID=221103 RepID=V2X5F5_MONRO|nr:hypothetical protein Moror_13118 [Moniliophthora roreri MCA 2997]KAI3618026.1 hypothetical protein WG66_005863 [Moniliophthora roreri]